MNFQKIVVPVIGIVLLIGAYAKYRWPGVAVVGSVIVMFLLLHLNRTLHVLKRASQRPIGHVDSAVMLNAKLKLGVSLLHVIALTRALGERRSVFGEQPEHYRWSDAGVSWVDAVFVNGKLSEWKLTRPDADLGTNSTDKTPDTATEATTAT